MCCGGGLHVVLLGKLHRWSTPEAMLVAKFICCERACIAGHFKLNAGLAHACWIQGLHGHNLAILVKHVDVCHEMDGVRITAGNHWMEMAAISNCHSGR